MEDYEKKYKEALERAKGEWVKNLDNAYKNYRERLEIIFPELKNKDEEIRKEIIEFVDINTLSVDERHDRWIAWLEKQGNSSKECLNLPHFTLLKLIEEYDKD